MAFPQVASSASGNSAANATTHTVTVHGGTIAAGQLLLVFFANDGAGVTASVTTPATGWTRLADLVVNTAVSAARFSVFYRWADGAEATTITVTTTASEGSAYTSYRITGADSGTNPSLTSVTTPSSATPDPPSHTPAWGALDTLWFVAYGWDGATVSHTSYPANYTSNQLTDRWNNTGGAGVASASRELNATVDNPGTGAISASEQWAAVTLSIKPGAGGSPQSVSPGLLGGYTLFAPTINQKVSLALLGGSTIFAPTVQPGGVSVSPALLGGYSIFAPTLSITPPGQTVSPSKLGGYSIFAPTINVGNVNVSPARLGGYTLFAPTIQPGGVNVSPALLGGYTLFAPSISAAGVGGQTVSPVLLGGYVIFPPTITVGGVVVSPARLGGYVLFAPVFVMDVVAGIATPSIDLVHNATASFDLTDHATATIEFIHNATATIDMTGEAIPTVVLLHDATATVSIS